MAEQAFKRVRASSFGGKAPKRNSGYKRPLAKLAAGHNQTNWLLVPSGLVINPPNKSDYTYWLECVVRLLGAHADGQGKVVIKLRKKLAAVRKSNRELQQRLDGSTADQPPNQTAIDDVERKNLDLRKEVEDLQEALKECRSNVELIRASQAERHEEIEARIREPYRQAAADNERRLQEAETGLRSLKIRYEKFKTTATQERHARLRAERLLRVANNNMAFMLAVNEAAAIDDIILEPTKSDHDDIILTVITVEDVKLVYTQRPSGKCTLVCITLEEAEEQIRMQHIVLDETGQLSEEQIRTLERLCWAATHEGKIDLTQRIGATKQYQEIYG